MLETRSSARSMEPPHQPTSETGLRLTSFAPEPDVEKIAVLRANLLGDLIVSLPALDALRAAYPQAEIVLIARDWHKMRILANEQYVVRFDSGDTYHCSPETRRTLRAHLDTVFPQCDLVVVSDYGYNLASDDLIACLSDLRGSRPCSLVVDSKNLLRFRQAGATVVDRGRGGNQQYGTDAHRGRSQDTGCRPVCSHQSARAVGPLAGRAPTAAPRRAVPTLLQPHLSVRATVFTAHLSQHSGRSGI